MDSIGAEVGEKMRSAIKAKLMELDCYVDDELPDYIMVMVANKRSKSQMNEDLHLFLDAKTSTFVDWLHVVLKKLKEVTVTNPDVYKKSAKRKLTEPSPVDIPDIKIKKENFKKFKTENVKDEEKKTGKNKEKQKEKSLTDDLPITANKLAEKRKIVVVNSESIDRPENDNFDIPLLSEVTSSGGENELKAIEDRIKTVKSRLGLIVESDEDEDQDFLNIKTEKEELFPKKDNSESGTQNKTAHRNIVEIEEIQEEIIEKINEDNEKQPHKRIVFDIHNDKSDKKSSRSVLDRLSSKIDNSSRSHQRIILSEFRKEEENFFRRADRNWQSDKSENSRNSREKESRRRDHKERKRSSDRSPRRSRSPLDDDYYKNKKLKSVRSSILSRVALPSKVSIPPQKSPEPEEPEEEFKKREVPSVIKVKPRVIPPNTPQPNKNLLLKAVAEAQRSVAQTPRVGNNLKPDALFTKKYKENQSSSSIITSRRIKESEKLKLKHLLEPASQSSNRSGSEEEVYVPKPLKKVTNELHYVPSKPVNTETTIKQQFIITLDGIEKNKFQKLEKKAEEAMKPSIKSRLDGRKTPSPIIFDKIESSPVKLNTHPNIPDKLPIVHPPISIKTKERCKYWPNCRQGDKCEFVHPTTHCDLFPNCKFRDKCLYLHPVCKFGTSCTKRDCIYSHNFVTKSIVLKPPVQTAPVAPVACKYFPNCANIKCPFFHPKVCKYGKFCKNKSECLFSHDSLIPSKSSLTWRAK